MCCIDFYQLLNSAVFPTKTYVFNFEESRVVKWLMAYSNELETIDCIPKYYRNFQCYIKKWFLYK